VGKNATVGLVATSRAAVIAAAMLGFLLAGWQLMQVGWRPLPGKTASGTDT
jgi:hypothetical protein